MQPVDQSGDELHFNGNRKLRKEVWAEATRHDPNENERNTLENRERRTRTHG